MTKALEYYDNRDEVENIVRIEKKWSHGGGGHSRGESSAFAQLEVRWPFAPKKGPAKKVILRAWRCQNGQGWPSIPFFRTPPPPSLRQVSIVIIRPCSHAISAS